MSWCLFHQFINGFMVINTYCTSVECRGPLEEKQSGAVICEKTSRLILGLFITCVFHTIYFFLFSRVSGGIMSQKLMERVQQQIVGSTGQFSVWGGNNSWRNASMPYWSAAAQQTAGATRGPIRESVGVERCLRLVKTVTCFLVRMNRFISAPRPRLKMQMIRSLGRHMPSRTVINWL